MKNKYHLIKAAPIQNQIKGSNIFDNPRFSILQSMKQKHNRPVGGISLFEKEKMRRQKKSSMRTINSANRRIRKSLLIDSVKIKEEDSCSSSSKQEILQEKVQQEQYKSHYNFRPSTAATYKTKTQAHFYYQNEPPRVTSAMSNVPSRTIQWANSQISDYNKKSAILGQISYKKTVKERYGDRYFEYWLRERHLEDIYPASYVYQVSEKETEDTNKFCKKLSKYRPDITKKQRLVLKGKQLRWMNPSPQV